MQRRSNSERLPLNNEARTVLITYLDFNGIGHDGFIPEDGTSRTLVSRYSSRESPTNVQALSFRWSRAHHQAALERAHDSRG